MSAMVTPINRYQIPTAAETVNTIATAMLFKAPSRKGRKMTSPSPVPEGEIKALVDVYSGILDTRVRQAIMDALVAIREGQELSST